MPPSLGPDPVKTAAGALSLKAYRLTKPAMEMVKERGYFNFDTLRNLKIGHENMFQELKVRHAERRIQGLMWKGKNLF